MNDWDDGYKLRVGAGGGGAVDSVNGATGVVVLDAGDIAVTPVGTVAATDVQAAIAELDSEKTTIAAVAAAYQPLDADLTSIAALTTTAAGRSALTITDPNADRVLAWDDSAGAVSPIALADITTEASPATGDYLLVYRAEGDMVKVNWSSLPGVGGGISNIVEDLTPQLGGDLDPNGFGPSGNWVPNAANTYALGSTAEPWSDLFLGSGAVINFDSSDITLTHQANLLGGAGGGLYWSYNGGGTSAPIYSVNTTDAASLRAGSFEGDRATPAANDEAYLSLMLSDSAGNQDEFARITWVGTDVTSTSEDGQLEIDVVSAGSLATAMAINNAGTTIGTTRAFVTGTIELGHATDTTLSRSAAGVLAVEGVPILKATSGVGNTPTSSTTTAITHGLGRTPVIIRISGKSGFTSNASATPTTSSEGVWTSSGNTCVYQSINGTTTIAAQTSTTFSVFLDTSVGNTISGVIQNVGATTFDIVWTETGTHTRGVYMWEAQ